LFPPFCFKIWDIAGYFSLIESHPQAIFFHLEPFPPIHPLLNYYAIRDFVKIMYKRHLLRMIKFLCVKEAVRKIKLT